MYERKFYYNLPSLCIINYKFGDTVAQATYHAYSEYCICDHQALLYTHNKTKTPTHKGETLMKIYNIFAMVLTTILMAMTTSFLGMNTGRDSVANDNISSVIYMENTNYTETAIERMEKGFGKCDSIVANENINNRYLGDEETGCYVNDGSLDF